MTRPSLILGILVAALPGARGAGATAPPPPLPVEEIVLVNGMRILVVERPGSPVVAAGWAVRAGAANDPPDQSGLAHLLEHLLFKGSRVVGARALDEETAVLEEEDRLRHEIRALEEREEAAAPAPSGGGLAERLARLRERAAALVERARELAFLGEFSLLYSENGGVGLNAVTLQDLALYHVTLPADRLELWFWLESDRLLEPVFRDVEREKGVIEEERRQRAGSSPAEELDHELLARFWGEGHAYAGSTLGDPGELASLDRPAARRYFAAHYRPQELTAVLVGPVQIGQAAELAERYFGRLPATAEPAATPPEGVRRRPSAAPPAGAPQRLLARYVGPPRARVLYPSVPFGQPDAYALDLVAGVLNGRSGRLYRALVLEQELAFAAYAVHWNLARAGSFAFEGEGRAGSEPAALLAAWDRELERLLAAPVPAAELDRARSRLVADSYRRLRDPASLMQQLLVYDALGDWRHVDRWPQRILALTAEEVRAAAGRHLVAARRTVAFYEQAPAGEASGWRAFPEPAAVEGRR